MLNTSIHHLFKQSEHAVGK